MGNVFPYTLMSETVRIQVCREIVRRNVHQYHLRRVLVLRFLLLRCPLLPLVMPWPPSSPLELEGHPQASSVCPYPSQQSVLSWTFQYSGVCTSYTISLPILPIAVFPMYRCVSPLTLCSSREHHSSLCFSSTDPDSYQQAVFEWMDKWTNEWGVPHRNACNPYLAASPFWPVLMWSLEEWLIWWDLCHNVSIKSMSV